ncbi:MAG: acetolactate synthase large subunit [Acetobacteraceae bacterium]|nr:acetolactate synthase large subunit [Acetobacteraceae bacterium]
MNGAESLVRTLLDSGVDTCFANPGTSEMHFVAALDRITGADGRGMRCVLGLFEGAVSGMADGYARMAEKPAATLLHCGPGMANALANMHNARRARTPMVNIVGDHATYHRAHDAPLTSDVEGAARPFSDWVQGGTSSRSIAADGAAAVQAARTPPGQVATLVLPANTAWEQADGPAPPLPVPARAMPAPAGIETAARLLRDAGAQAVLLLAGPAVATDAGQRAALRIATATGCKLIAQGSNARFARGQGRVPIERVPYVIDIALGTLKGFRVAVLAGMKAPVGFFAYPGKPGLMLPPGCATHELARIEQDVVGGLEALAEALGAARDVKLPDPGPRPEVPRTAAVSPEALAMTLAALLPEGAIVADESVSFGRGFFPNTHAAAPHDWLQVTGGAIGCGLPLAAGAAIACPDRKVVCLEADGSAMYTLQALWTMARERSDVCVTILSNRKYQILLGELAGVGANPGRTALDMMDLSNPDLDWPTIARGMGVEGARATSIAEYADLFGAAMARRGPFLIELVI